MAVYESSNGSEECLSTLILFPMKIGHPAHVRIQVDTRHQENRHTKKKNFFFVWPLMENWLRLKRKCAPAFARVSCFDIKPLRAG